MSNNMTPEELPQPEYHGLLSPDDLSVDKDNPNEMTDEQFGLLCDRMRQNGWLGGPIITDSDGLIADGQHRWQAAQEIGLSEVPVKQYDIDDATRRLWRQELNKIHGEHDTKRDALEYDYLLDNGKTDEVQALTNAADEDLDELLAEIKMDSSRPAVYEYDTEHNVYFEDCVEGMKERLDDDSVDCVITDPPYGIGVDMNLTVSDATHLRSNEPKHNGTVSGDMDIDEAIQIFRETFSEITRVLKDDGLFYVFASWKTYPAFATAIESFGYNIQNCIVWEKSNSNPLASWGDGKPSYDRKHEFILFGCADNATSFSSNHDDIMQYDDARFSDVSDGNHVHPTQKPVALISDLIKQATGTGDLVCDPFMGSGTTAVAAIQNDRDYVGFELDEDNYRSVIERRIGEAKRQVEANQD